MQRVQWPNRTFWGCCCCHNTHFFSFLSYRRNDFWRCNTSQAGSFITIRFHCHKNAFSTTYLLLVFVGLCGKKYIRKFDTNEKEPEKKKIQKFQKTMRIYIFFLIVFKNEKLIPYPKQTKQTKNNSDERENKKNLTWRFRKHCRQALRQACISSSLWFHVQTCRSPETRLDAAGSWAETFPARERGTLCAPCRPSKCSHWW